ncbi:LOW QUALITY PROTEIN: hypothetical protein PanWU01x14_241970 [Parasponia andersonii]|uniref:Uncharacterized protein n=1 Tax=Parasponia andersonii TaxID=3476 RepID=A0A2P5BGB9_PARAD|nr:LOW QUALITY PROTEIN: hypothetical protein PanWU01x14_241970 [Parasponia andersonii]
MLKCIRSKHLVCNLSFDLERILASNITFSCIYCLFPCHYCHYCHYYVWVIILIAIELRCFTNLAIESTLNYTIVVSMALPNYAPSYVLSFSQSTLL